ncbi:hypothetical protein ACFOQM_22765 [Paenibacillus sp. GCM10012307]|uniref:Uncharacterized protein n=1 Tax=Paenibacillus roseus TaxID=2798579 RepID=A0A934J9J3_9BACL|nr:hypothetical protein [Paenibacillus roseus]MBJ6364053.1 hypothetical protein [Paenibacillus roseus]
MDVKQLKSWVLSNGLEDRSLKGFWNAFMNYQHDCSEEFEKIFPNFAPEKLSLSVDKVALTISNWPEEDYNHVVITIRIEYENCYAGYYSGLSTQN